MLSHFIFVLFLGQCAHGFRADGEQPKAYHYKSVGGPAVVKAATAPPLTPASTSLLSSVPQLLLYPRVVPFYPGVVYYPQVVAGKAGPPKKLTPYSIPAPVDEVSGR